jgi:hypothetical protein
MADLAEKTAINRAIKAQALLEDEELIEAFTAVRESLLRRIEECPIRDREGVHELKLQLKLLADVRANLSAVVNTGKVIQYRITMLERAKKGVANAFRR